MLKARIIPCLLLKGGSLVKTIRFNKYNYIGDPVNTVRIFNELEVDELIFLDINATIEKRGPNFKIINEISNECFMPLSYGGGIKTLEDVKKLFSIGIEKIALNSITSEDPDFITRVTDIYGNQSVIASIDVKKNLFGKYEVYTHSGTKKIKKDPIEWAIELEKRGAGELLLTSIDQEGTWNGLDITLIKNVTDEVRIPIIAHGGAKNLADIEKATKEAKASAIALGNMVVYQKKDMGVLVNFPEKKDLLKIL